MVVRKTNNINIKKESKWYAFYTKSRNEKKVYQKLIEKNLECYLPIEKKLKQWNDRKKWVEEPLIRSYIFVKIFLYELQNVLETSGVVTIVRFGGSPAAIPENQIDVIKKILRNDIDYEINTEKLDIGQKVEVSSGNLKGLKGELVNHYNKYKVLIRIESINQNLLLQINSSNLLKLENFS
ncbi:MAG: UpxY family transcription antiterminator [Bacteroidales bacterium]|jgi:transcriptional antiterminator RfaH|nr:UpxY family transcription antiterminator [Bacteroidales bacterium]